MDVEAATQAVQAALDQALEALEQMRQVEGEAIRADLEARLELIERLEPARWRELAPRSVEEYRQRLTERVAELARGVAVDPQRLAQEVAFFAERTDIAEEMTRLASHLEQFRALMASSEPSGRRMDFLVQEMHREVNTTGSKSQHAEISARVVVDEGRGRAHPRTGAERRMNEPTPLQPGLLLVLSAPSGAGKTTLARRLLGELPDAVFSVSVTTRGPEGRSRTGWTTTSWTSPPSRSEIERGEFVEWAEVHGHFYGSPQSVVDEARARRGVAIFDIDVQGGQAIKRKHPDAVLVFVLPPSMEELERRLRDRGTDAEETIRRRMLAARSEIERGVASYDYIIVNDDFERAYRDLRSVVVAERCRRGRVDLSKLKLEKPTP